MTSDYFSFEPWKSFQGDSLKWYEAIELLGVGGNAATFLAYCTTKPFKGLLYAVKVFRRFSKPERKASFHAEAKVLQQFDHPGIMRVFDEGTYYGAPFIVVEHLPRTLADVMRSNPGTLDAVTFSFQLLSAINYLAEQSPPVVHRDIKPENIFIKGGSCVLGDFGMMKRLNEEELEDRAIIKESIGAGMPFYYRTPDLVDYLNGVAPLTTKTDVFQLGLVLAQLFTGRNPLKVAPNFTDPIELEPLGHVSSTLGNGIAPLIMRMLIEDPAQRPPAGELIDPWQGVFREAVDRAHALDERAFRYK